MRRFVTPESPFKMRNFAKEKRTKHLECANPALAVIFFKGPGALLLRDLVVEPEDLVLLESQPPRKTAPLSEAFASLAPCHAEVGAKGEACLC